MALFIPYSLNFFVLTDWDKTLRNSKNMLTGHPSVNEMQIIKMDLSAPKEAFSFSLLVFLNMAAFV